jgi:effector-binding domain-containing protein
MQQQPRIVERPEQPYVGIRDTVTRSTIGQLADRLPELFSWLAARAVVPSGAPFLKYNVIDMERELDMEVGVPVELPQAGEEEIISGVLPAGRYASVTHVGHPDELMGVTEDLLAWADEQNLEWDVEGDRWGSRLEVYKSDPRLEPDLSKWETELLFRLRD